jgi:hypothetical protein
MRALRSLTQKKTGGLPRACLKVAASVRRLEATPAAWTHDLSAGDL